MQELKLLDFPDGMDRFRGLMIHKDADAELRAIYENKLGSVQPKLAANLNMRFHYLIDHMGQETLHKEWFEVLKGVKPSMRSMKLKLAAPIGNLRLVYTLRENRAVILACFIEKAKDDYRKGIESAQRRYKEILS